MQTTSFPHIYSVERGNNKKLAILATGGGMGLGNLATVPGSSKMLECFYVPYSVEESTRFVIENGQQAEHLKQAVSVQAVTALYKAMANRHPNCKIIAVSAACTSLRYRRGDNRAFIAFTDSKNEMKITNLTFKKLDEATHKGMTLEQLHEQRCFEDDVITKVALALVVDSSNTLDTMFECGILTEV